MKRFTLMGFAALLVVGALAGTALARGGDWQPVTATPFDWTCGTTTVHITLLVNKEYQQISTLPDGTLLLKVTGSLKVALATDAAASISVNASGPGNSLFDPVTNAFEFIGTGNNLVFLTAAQSAATGLPEIFTASGSIDLLFLSDGTVQVNQVNHPTVTDLCKALT
jgi:hypothetical protein